VAENNRLGKGLGALFGNTAATQPPPHPIATADVADPIPAPNGASFTLQASVDAIDPNPRQPRQMLDDNAMLSLIESVRAHGIIQPIIVVLRPSTGEEGPRYQIIAGERRWEAAKKAGLKTIPVVVKNATPQQMLEMALIENLQREDLNPIEIASAYQVLVEEYNLTQEEVARRVGKDRTTVANSIALLRLPQEVQDKLLMRLDSFTAGHAKALIGIANSEDQIRLMNQIISQGLTVRDAEDAARGYREAAIRLVSDRKGGRTASPEIARLEEDIRNAISLQVSLKRKTNGGGSLTIAFANEDELNMIYELLVLRNANEEF
jgi:ParB family chromosome partitioning protein